MSEPEREHIAVEHPAEGVALVTIDRARHFNTLSEETLVELDGVFASIATDSNVRAVVLRGEGDETFAAGANIREVSALTQSTAPRFAWLGQRVLDRIERAPQLVIAAVTGYCMGGGLDLALACDVRIASPSSVFAHPGAKLGIITGFGGTSRLVRTIGKAAAIEMFVTARRVSAGEALAMRLVDAVVDDPVRAAILRASDAAAADDETRRAMKSIAVASWRARPVARS